MSAETIFGPKYRIQNDARPGGQLGPTHYLMTFLKSEEFSISLIYFLSFGYIHIYIVNRLLYGFPKNRFSAFNRLPGAGCP